MRIIALSLAVSILAVSAAVAGDCRVPACGPAECFGTPDACGACGVKSCCQKTCKVVCEMKKVKRTVWAVECEEFCAPLPNFKRSCGSCGVDGCEVDQSGDCGSCGEDPCAPLYNRDYIPPKCSKVRTRKKLVKKEVTCEVPVYKCVVVYCCPGCCDAESGLEDAPVPEATQQAIDVAPMPPVVSGVGYFPMRPVN